MIKTVEIADLKKIAKRRVPKMFFDYADSGCMDGKHLSRQ